MHAESIDLHVLVQAERERVLEAARSSFEELLAWVQGPGQKLSLFRAERDALDRLMALGVALMGLWLACHLPGAVPARIRSGHGWYGYRALAADRVRTRFGVVWAVDQCTR